MCWNMESHVNSEKNLQETSLRVSLAHSVFSKQVRVSSGGGVGGGYIGSFGAWGTGFLRRKPTTILATPSQVTRRYIPGNFSQGSLVNIVNYVLYFLNYPPETVTALWPSTSPYNLALPAESPHSPSEPWCGFCPALQGQLLTSCCS